MMTSEKGKSRLATFAAITNTNEKVEVWDITRNHRKNLSLQYLLPTWREWFCSYTPGEEN
jgi:hypothetical protein